MIISTRLCRNNSYMEGPGECHNETQVPGERAKTIKLRVNDSIKPTLSSLTEVINLLKLTFE